MKKRVIAATLVAALVVSAASCGQNNNNTSSDVTTTTTAAAPASSDNTAADATKDTSGENETKPAAKIMTHDEFMAAELETEVTVETYVQAKQGWWEKEGVGGVATFYTQNEEGAYFIYDMPCSKEDYDKLTAGTKIRVTGFKAEWSGEVEILDATYEILEGSYIAKPVDVTALLGTDELQKHMNEFVTFKGMKVMPILDANENETNFLYSYDGSGEEGSDLYFKAAYSGINDTYTVESYLCGPDSEVYKAVKNLKVGEIVDMEGFLYWYNGANPHITSVKPSEVPPVEDTVSTMSYDEFMAADLDSKVTVETYVQAKQGWWENNGVGNASFYTQTEEGGYFLYNMPCSKEDYDKLVPGTKIKVTGYKAEWSGEVEITDAEFEILDGTYIAEPIDVTQYLGTDELAKYMNRLVCFKGMKIMPILDAEEKETNFLYSYDGSGEEGSDLYFKAAYSGINNTYTVESYLCGPETEVYQAVKNLTINSIVDMEGFLYWYNGANPHITSIKPATVE